MNRRGVSVFVCVLALLCPSFALAQFGMGCCEFGMGAAGLAGTSCVTVGNVTVAPWLGFGYQSLGLNVNYPFNGPFVGGNAHFEAGVPYYSYLDVSLRNNALWIGSLGFDVAYRQRLRFFGAAGTNLFVSNGGSLGTGGYNEWNLLSGSGYNPTSTLGWQCYQTRWWEFNLGGLYCLTDDVAILIGYKCDSLSEKPLRGTDDPANSYYADFQAITRSPYIGVKICQRYLDFSLVWSPRLTSYDVKIPLSVIGIWSDGSPWTYNAGNSWELSDGGGNLIEAFAKAKLNISELLGVNLWLKGSWLQCRGNGNLNQSGQWYNNKVLDPSYTPYLTGSGSGDCTFTRNLWALGISGQLMF